MGENVNIVPKIKVCQKGCNLINIYEETNPNYINNPTGWGTSADTPNINYVTDDILNAYVEIFDYTGNDLITTIVLKDLLVDVYTPVAGSPTPSTFLAAKEQEWNEVDGVFVVSYTIEILPQGSEEVELFISDYQRVLFTCKLESCINKLKGLIIEECDSAKMSELKRKIDQLEILLYGIKSAFACANIDLVYTLLEQAKAICDNLCDCGCGDC